MPEDVADPFSNLGSHYAGEIVGSASQFSQTVYRRTTLTLRVFEAARARTAEINGCLVCRAFRAKRDMASNDGSKVGSVVDNGDAPDEDFYQNVSAWKTYEGFNARERVAIELAERFCEEPQALSADDDFWARAHASFSDDEIVELTHAVASFVATGRVAHVLGLDRVCTIETIGEISQ